MYGVDPAWEVGASQSWYQSGILPAYFTSPHIESATAQGLLHPGMVIAENFSYEGIRSTLWKLYVIIMEFLSQKENVGHEDNVGWCLSLVVASSPTARDRGLRAQLAQQNQVPPDARVPPAPVNQPAAPEIPDVDPVIPENPIAPEIPVAPVAVPPAPLVRTLEELYDRFRRMKAPEFEGSTNPIEADNWLIDLQVALNFLRLNDQEKVLCASFMLRKDARLWWETVQIRREVTQMTWEDFVEEFKEQYFNTEVMEAQQDEFDKFRQGNLSVAEAVKKFEQLARLCPHLISSERDKDKIRSNELSFSRRRGKKRPKLSRTRPDQAKHHNKKVKEDLRVKTTTTSSTATTNKRGSGMQEDRGINKIFPRRRMLLITTVIPLVRHVGEGTREIAVLELVAAFYVAKKATMLELAISIPMNPQNQ
ncbi:hypothetical protein TIFTF001_037548 [Ficus carica]|uniref:Retrotransposon gag domain-containing protein n=1 Tax=Ficus carica TaxID=3494 RepID=A0AA88E6C5_FICCA|nr:hypothetical protein TIFTF001_037542 [Ficus carica]GMN68494.1 hypothetical protein TIFTF001_037548 [Ficus carica]